MAIQPASVDKSSGNYDAISWGPLSPGDTGDPVNAGSYSAICVTLKRVSAPSGDLSLEGSTDGGVSWVVIATSNPAYRVIDNPPELIRPRAGANLTEGGTAIVTITGKFAYLSGRC